MRCFKWKIKMNNKNCKKPFGDSFFHAEFLVPYLHSWASFTNKGFGVLVLRCYDFDIVCLPRVHVLEAWFLCDDARRWWDLWNVDFSGKSLVTGGKYSEESKEVHMRPLVVKRTNFYKMASPSFGFLFCHVMFLSHIPFHHLPWCDVVKGALTRASTTLFELWTSELKKPILFLKCSASRFHYSNWK